MKTIILLTSLLLLFPNTNFAQCSTDTVYVKNLEGIGFTSLLSEPDVASKTLLDLKYGDTLRLIDCRHEIYYKALYKNITGYISKGYVSEKQVIEGDYVYEDDIIQTKSSFGEFTKFPIKYSPKPSSDILFYIPMATELKILSFEDGYYFVKYGDKEGYLSELYIETKKKPRTSKQSGNASNSNTTHNYPIMTGPRGGQYHYNSKGNKVYESSTKRKTSSSRKRK